LLNNRNIKLSGTGKHLGDKVTGIRSLKYSKYRGFIYLIDFD
jgi:hypothetical protein